MIVLYISFQSTLTAKETTLFIFYQICVNLKICQINIFLFSLEAKSQKQIFILSIYT